MKIINKYELKESKVFYLSPNQQKTIDLKLNKISKPLLYGRVYDKYKNPISNASITLAYYNRPVITKVYTKTNKCGQYLIYDIAPNKYIIHVNHPKYMPIKITKTINHPIKKNFYLEPFLFIKGIMLKHTQKKRYIVKPKTDNSNNYDIDIIFYPIKHFSKK